MFYYRKHFHTNYFQVTGDNVRDQVDSTALGNVESLDQRQRNGRRLDFAQHCGAKTTHELMGHDEDKVVGILGRFDQIGNGDLENKLYI